MKTLKYLAVATAVVMAFAACSDDDEPAVAPEEENIVAEFDPRFVSKLFLQGYIDDIYRITRADVEGITRLDVHGMYEDYEAGVGLTSLKGIEYFTALDTLICYRNQLTALDISRNTALKYLSCMYNQLPSLDVSQHTALKYLNCSSNRLTTLDVSRNTALEILYCDKNLLTSVDISQNTALELFSCWDNQLTSLDISRNTALEYLDCEENRLTALDISQNRKLENLWCAYNPGQDGFFEVMVWPGCEVKVRYAYWNEEVESWEYEGETVEVKYVGNEE